MSSDDERLFLLLEEWERRRPRGPVDLAELAGDDASMRSRLQAAVKILEDADWMENASRGDASPDPSRSAAVRGDDGPISRAIGEFANYEIVAEIARGGMGIVYLARERTLGRVVALKTMRAADFATPEQLRRFLAEARAVAQLNHAAIVPIYEIGEFRGQPFYTMAFVEGGSLHARLQQQGPLPPRDASALLATVAEGVEHVHRAGIVHRDIKPQNVMLAADGRPRLADFGLAKRLDETNGVTVTGDVLGTPSYMAPEQAGGRSKEATPAIDVYALGAVLYAMLTGRPPFLAATLAETLRSLLEQPPVSPRLLNPSIPRDLEVICLKCLEKEPARRYATAQALIDDLRRFLAGEPISARPVGKAEKVRRWCRRHPSKAIAAIVSVVAAASIAALAVALTVQSEIQADRDRALLLADLTERFEQRIDALELSADHLLQAEALAERLRELDERAGRQAEIRLLDAYGSETIDRIRDVRLDDSDRASIETALASIAARDPKRAEELRRRYQERLRDWDEWFATAAPHDSAHELFPQAIVAADGTLEFDSAAEPVRAVSIQGTSGDCEVQARFAEGWQRQRVIGLLLNADESGERAYSFVLSPTSDQEASSSPTLADVVEDDGEVVAEFVRDGETLQRFYIDASELNPQGLTLRAQRRDSLLSFQIDRLPTLQFEELFGIPETDRGRCGILASQAVRLEEIRLNRRIASREHSPLERGDVSYREGDFSAALDLYRQVATSASDSRIREEARLKEGMCLAALNREEDASEAFAMLLSSGVDERTAMLAGLQGWLLHLRRERFDDADDIYESLKSRFDFETLVSVAPLDVRETILNAYLRKNSTGYLSVRRDPDRVRDAQRLDSIYGMLGAPLGQRIDARCDLARALLFDGRVAEAARSLEDLMEREELERADLNVVLPDYAWALDREGRRDEALATLDQALFTRTGTLRRSTISLLIERAQLKARAGDYEEAKADCETFLAAGSDDYPTNLVRARTLYGFLLEDLGDTAGARTAWAEAYQLSREIRYRTHLYAAVAGSVGGTLDAADADAMLAEAGQSEMNAAVMKFITDRFLPQELVITTLQNMWRTRLGKEWARKVAYRDLDADQFHRIQVLLAAAEVWRQMILGTTDPDRTMSPEQESLVWRLCQDHLAAYLAGSTSEMHLVFIAQTYNGSTGPFGWGGVAPSLPANLRGPMAYAFGCHYRRRGDLRSAERFFRTASEDAEPGSNLSHLVEIELGTIAATVDPPAEEASPDARSP